MNIRGHNPHEWLYPLLLEREASRSERPMRKWSQKAQVRSLSNCCDSEIICCGGLFRVVLVKGPFSLIRGPARIAQQLYGIRKYTVLHNPIAACLRANSRSAAAFASTCASRLFFTGAPKHSNPTGLRKPGKRSLQKHTKSLWGAYNAPKELCGVVGVSLGALQGAPGLLGICFQLHEYI